MHHARPGTLFALLAVALLLAAFVAICLLAPREATMGDAQRVLYVHVAVAWIALLAMLTAAAAGIAYLLRRDLNWDFWAQAAAELGWLANTLTLATGVLWAHSAWGVWWTWDPRLTASLVLWTIYCSYFFVRSGHDDPQRSARVAAVVAAVGAIDVPLIVLATRWFRGVHPLSPQLEPAMRWTLLLTAGAFTAFFVLLLARRHRQLCLAQRLAALQDRWELEYH